MVEQHRMVQPVLTATLTDRLDALIDTDDDLGAAPIVWLHMGFLFRCYSDPYP